MEGEIVTMQDIVRFTQQGVDENNKVVGEFQYTGVQPNCLRRFAEYGVSFGAATLALLSPTAAAW
jgi:pilus assembly protein CpaF